ncbi:hypothetical protein PspLS_00533 [Pyricularia sp. CBS 133598]|nr:hypothetical protein PspLS_00533 [Pyricularia sp. CBS 133598]
MSETSALLPSTSAAETLDRSDTASLLRRLVELIRCPFCSLPLDHPVTLPCGRTLCRRCLPRPRARAYITYPAGPNRLQGFDCPFDNCSQEHATDDCALDVATNNVVASIQGALGAGELSQLIVKDDDEALAEWLQTQRRPAQQPGSQQMPSPKATPRSSEGGQDVEDRCKVPKESDRGLAPSAEVSPVEITTRDPAYQTFTPKEQGHVQILERISEATRPEVDCQVCYALFYDAVTTHCGHTFCRHCLHRILDHSDLCAVCRRQIHRGEWPQNKLMAGIETTLWATALEARKQAILAESRHGTAEFDIPVFVCTLSFPTMPTFLHVFEPRYRLMIRRALEQDRTFGMVLHRRARRAGEPDFVDIGTLLRVINVEFFPDGRSLIETVGVSRFRILQHGMKDGYVVAKIERVNDVSIAEEEAFEAAEMREALDTDLDTISQQEEAGDKPATVSANASCVSVTATVTTNNRQSPEAPPNFDVMPTRELLRFGVDFVARMREASAGWLTHRILAIYGDCPEDDAAKFPWWFASVLPVNDLEKYRLLGTASVRERLKVCCHWIQEWESSRW